MFFRLSKATSDEERKLVLHVERAIRELEEASDLLRRSNDPDNLSRKLDLRKDLRRHIFALRNLETILPKREEEPLVPKKSGEKKLTTTKVRGQQ